MKLSVAITLTPQTSINKPKTILFTIDIPMLQALMPRFAQGPPHLVLTSHGSHDPRTSRTCWFSNRGRGKPLKNRSLRISQLTNKSTPTVTDASHGLHMPESQNDSDRCCHEIESDQSEGEQIRRGRNRVSGVSPFWTPLSA